MTFDPAALAYFLAVFACTVLLNTERDYGYR